MRNATHPNPFFYSRVKPPHGALLDQDNIWAKGIIFAALMNEGAGPVIDYVSKTPGTLVGGIAWTNGSSGPAITSPVFGGSASDWVTYGSNKTYSRDLAVGPTTWVIRTTLITSTSTAYAERISGTNDGWLIDDGGLVQQIRLFRGRVTANGSYTTNTLIPLNVTTNIIITIQNDACVIYYDGVSQPISVTLGSGAVKSEAGQTLNIWGSPAGAVGNGQINECLYIYDHVWDAMKVTQFQESGPFVMFQYPMPNTRFFLSVPAVGGAAAAPAPVQPRRNLLGVGV